MQNYLQKRRPQAKFMYKNMLEKAFNFYYRASYQFGHRLDRNDRHSQGFRFILFRSDRERTRSSIASE